MNVASQYSYEKNLQRRIVGESEVTHNVDFDGGIRLSIVDSTRWLDEWETKVAYTESAASQTNSSSKTIRPRSGREWVPFRARSVRRSF